MTSLVAQTIKCLPTVRETWVRSLGWEDPWEKGKATHSSILAWRIPWTVWSLGHKESDMIESNHFTSLQALVGLGFEPDLQIVADREA